MVGKDFYKPELRKSKDISMDSVDRTLFKDIMNEDGTIDVEVEVEVLKQRVSTDLYSSFQSGVRELLMNEIVAVRRANKIRNCMPEDEGHIDIHIDPQERKLVIHGVNSLGIDPDTFSIIMRTIGRSGNTGKKAGNQTGQMGMGFFSYSTLTSTMKLETHSLETGDKYAMFCRDGLKFIPLKEKISIPTGTRLSMTYNEDCNEREMIKVIEKCAELSGVKIVMHLENSLFCYDEHSTYSTTEMNWYRDEDQFSGTSSGYNRRNPMELEPYVNTCPLSTPHEFVIRRGLHQPSSDEYVDHYNKPMSMIEHPQNDSHVKLYMSKFTSMINGTTNGNKLMMNKDIEESIGSNSGDLSLNLKAYQREVDNIRVTVVRKLQGKRSYYSSKELEYELKSDWNDKVQVFLCGAPIDKYDGMSINDNIFACILIEILDERQYQPTADRDRLKVNDKIHESVNKMVKAMEKEVFHEKKFSTVNEYIHSSDADKGLWNSLHSSGKWEGTKGNRIINMLHGIQYRMSSKPSDHETLLSLINRHCYPIALKTYSYDKIESIDENKELQKNLRDRLLISGSDIVLEEMKEYAKNETAWGYSMEFPECTDESEYVNNITCHQDGECVDSCKHITTFVPCVFTKEGGYYSSQSKDDYKDKPFSKRLDYDEWVMMFMIDGNYLLKKYKPLKVKTKRVTTVKKVKRDKAEREVHVWQNERGNVDIGWYRSRPSVRFNSVLKKACDVAEDDNIIVAPHGDSGISFQDLKNLWDIDAFTSLKVTAKGITGGNTMEKMSSDHLNDIYYTNEGQMTMEQILTWRHSKDCKGRGIDRYVEEAKRRSGYSSSRPTPYVVKGQSVIIPLTFEYPYRLVEVLKKSNCVKDRHPVLFVVSSDPDASQRLRIAHMNYSRNLQLLDDTHDEYQHIYNEPDRKGDVFGLPNHFLGGYGVEDSWNHNNIDNISGLHDSTVKAVKEVLLEDIFEVKTDGSELYNPDEYLNQGRVYLPNHFKTAHDRLVAVVVKSIVEPDEWRLMSKVLSFSRDTNADLNVIAKHRGVGLT